MNDGYHGEHSMIRLVRRARPRLVDPAACAAPDVFLRKLAAVLGCGVLLAVLLAAPRLAPAALTIEIVGSGERRIPVAIAPLPGEEALPFKISEIVAADLTRSGLFRIIDAGGVNPPPVEPADIRYPEWSARGAESIVIGAVTATG